MKKIAVFLAVLLLLAAPVLAAEPTEALSDVLGADELTQSLPDEAAEVLDGFSPDGTPDFRSGVRSILRAAAGGSGGALRSGLRLCAVLLAMVTLCAVVRMSTQKDPVNAVSAVGALGICAACLGGMQSMISLASETVTRLSDYSACLLPVMASAMAMSGGTVSAGTLYAGTALFSGLLSRLIARLLLPGVSVYLVVAAAEAALADSLLSELREFVGWLISKKPACRAVRVHGLPDRDGRHLRQCGCRRRARNKGGRVRHGARGRQHSVRRVRDAAGKRLSPEKLHGRVRYAGRPRHLPDTVSEDRCAVSAPEGDGGRQRDDRHAAAGEAREARRDGHGLSARHDGGLRAHAAYLRRVLSEGGGMMEAIRSYLTAVVAVSMIAVLASALSHGSRMERVVRFAAGLLALLVCVTPLLRLDARTLTDVLGQAERALDYDASKTDRTRQDMLRDLIRENTERTIEKQAEALGMLVRADVTLTEEEYPQPWSATLTGTLDPEQVRALSEFLSQSLGIPTERQTWKTYG